MVGPSFLRFASMWGILQDDFARTSTNAGALIPKRLLAS